MAEPSDETCDEPVVITGVGHISLDDAALAFELPADAEQEE